MPLYTNASTIMCLENVFKCIIIWNCHTNSKSGGGGWWCMKLFKNKKLCCVSVYISLYVYIYTMFLIMCVCVCVCVCICVCVAFLYVCLCKEGEEENKRDEVAQKTIKERENEKIKEERKYKSSRSLLSFDNDTISAIKKILTRWNNRHHGRPLKIARLATQPTCLEWAAHTSSGLVV